MKKDNYITEVVFRKFKDGTIIALFPYEFSDRNGYFCISYMHLGQHSSTDYTHVISKTKSVKEDEYNSLLRELESIGYNLIVIHKVTASKLYEARNKYLEHLNSLKNKNVTNN